MPSGIYQSKNRKGGVKGRSGVYPKTQEHKDKIRDTLKRKGIKPPISHYWLGKKITFKNPEERNRKISENNARYWLGRKDKIGLKKENHWHWKEDRTQLVKSEKKHLDGKYREWAFSVKRRDNWKCRIANLDCKGEVEAHHILSWSKFPELRYEVNNGILLCHFHHPRKRNDEMRLSLYFQSIVMTKAQ